MNKITKKQIKDALNLKNRQTGSLQKLADKIFDVMSSDHDVYSDCATQKQIIDYLYVDLNQ